MKTLNKTFILVVIAASVIACGGNESTEKANDAEMAVVSEGAEKIDYAVEGMVCAMGCAATIQKEVANMEGVIISEVNYADEKAHFEFDPSKTSEADIKAKIATIADGQYKLSKLEEKELEDEIIEDAAADEEIEKEEELVKVSLPSFEIPNLFTLLLNQL